ncbi:MAG TPA: hypothetical protein VLA14_02355 [Polyangia bacterium]|jgi:hypothetical protein|nr:hypothetical protein [Polyangia bacterium]
MTHEVARLAALVGALSAAFVVTPARAGALPQNAPPPPPAAPSPAAPAPPPVAPAPPAAVVPEPALVVLPPEPAPPPPAPTPAPSARPPVGPVPTADAEPAPSDHDAVVGHVGIEVRRIDASPLAYDVLPASACPTRPSCTVSLGAIELRDWQTRNFALTGGLALGFGGGRASGMASESYVGVGPIVGMSLLLGNWRHLAVAAAPELSYVWFTPNDGSSRTTLITVRAAVEGELHFGFVGVPALSVGMDTGLGFRWVSSPDARVWSVGVVGPGGVASILSDLFIRYYL